ncbi:cupin domain-containing protein [Pseudomonas aeruginosa]|uniref:cupin domain-containing protein n=3 Tax=Pseudomonas TaxID=286 RepID=UPI0018797E7F|nr:cupin domain-containing protein [Pseudomonas aeruginosa]
MDLRPSHVHVFPPSRDLPAATSPQRETLLRSGCAWNGSLYLGYPLGQPQLTVQRLSLAAHERLDWQVHPMPSALYVLKGELRLETRDGAQSTRVLEGEAAGCLMNIIHRLIAGAEPVEALLFHAGVEGMPVGLGERGEMPDAGRRRRAGQQPEPATPRVTLRRRARTT